jgi:excinuclease ABC subunit A
MDSANIVIRGAREHNLQNIHLELPRNQLIVFTGVSGSGKSSLAFDTLYAEGQRRYVESLSSYARQFLGQLQKPDVDYLAGLSPSISIQQKAAGKNPRSTVGTITEIHDYLRVLYARIGQGHCPICDRPITAQSREQILNRILALPEGTRFLVLAPVVRGQKGEYKDLFHDMVRRGYLRARVDGQVVKLTDDLKLDRRIKHDIAIVVDRLSVDAKVRSRLAEAVEQALNLAEGNIIVALEEEREGETPAEPAPRENGSPGASPSRDIILSAHYACTHCNKSYEPPSPQLFSFNSPHGMCLDCDGLGTRYSFDADRLVPDPTKSFYDGAIPIVGPLRGMGRWRKHLYEGVAKTFDIDVKKPWRELSDEHKNILLHGTGDRHIAFEWKMRGGKIWKHGGTWEGIVPQLLSSFKKTAAGPRRLQLEKYMRVMRCPTCQGQRLNAQARAVRVGGKTLIEVEAMPIGELAAWLGDPHQPGAQATGSTNSNPSNALSPWRCSRKSAPASAFCSTSACTISLSTAPRRRSPAAKPSASASPGRSAPASSASSIFSMNHPSACIRAITTACCAASKSCATWATPSSSSNMTKTRCAPPTSWSISVPAQACAAAMLSPPALMPTLSRRRPA